VDVSYPSIRQLHVASVALTFTLFVVRVGWMLRSPQRLQQRWVRVVPHAIDTALLLSGAWLAWRLGAAGVRGWLPAKLVALVIYIVLAAVALRYGRTLRTRALSAAGALLTFAYIVFVALTKTPLGA